MSGRAEALMEFVPGEHLKISMNGRTGRYYGLVLSKAGGICTINPKTPVQ